MTRILNRFVTGSYCSAQGQVARAHGSFKLAHRRVGKCAPCVCVCVCVHTCACMLKEEGAGRGRNTEYQELSLHKEIKRIFSRAIEAHLLNNDDSSSFSTTIEGT